MRIRRVLCGPCRRAKLTPFEKNLSELVAGLLLKRKWQLATHHLACQLLVLVKRGASQLWQEKQCAFVACTQQPLHLPAQLVSLGADV